jgi:hypothetical protein
VETAPLLHDAALLLGCEAPASSTGCDEAALPTGALRALNFERFRLLIEGARCGLSEAEHVALAAERLARAARRTGAPRRRAAALRAGPRPAPPAERSDSSDCEGEMEEAGGRCAVAAPSGGSGGGGGGEEEAGASLHHHALDGGSQSDGGEGSGGEFDHVEEAVDMHTLPTHPHCAPSRAALERLATECGFGGRAAAPTRHLLWRFRAAEAEAQALAAGRESARSGALAHLFAASRRRPSRASQRAAVAAALRRFEASQGAAARHSLDSPCDSDWECGAAGGGGAAAARAAVLGAFFPGLAPLQRKRGREEGGGASASASEEDGEPPPRAAPAPARAPAAQPQRPPTAAERLREQTRLALEKAAAKLR